MNCIVFIGTHKSGSSYDAISAAKNMGYCTVLLTDSKYHLERKKYFSNVDIMIFCPLDDIEIIKYEIDSLEMDKEISAIVSFIEEHCYIANILAKEYGCVYFTTASIGIMLNKLETRKACMHYSAFFREINHKDDIDREEFEQKCPLILKRPMSAGSKEVIRVNSYNEYKKELSNCPNESMLIEEYLYGPQFLVEAIVVEGGVHIVAIVKQEISYVHRYIVTGYKMILEHDNELIQGLITAAKDVIKLTGMETGSCHFEFRHTAGQWRLIEANPRISGGCMNLLIELAYGINLVKETLKLALGQELDLKAKYKREVFAQYVIVNNEGILLRVTGRNKASECEGVLHINSKPKKGQLLIPPLSMGNRYAYVIATGDTADEARRNAKHAASQIRFVLKEIDKEILEKLTFRQRHVLDKLYKIRLEMQHNQDDEGLRPDAYRDLYDERWN